MTEMDLGVWELVGVWTQWLSLVFPSGGGRRPGMAGIGWQGQQRRGSTKRSLCFQPLGPRSGVRKRAGTHYPDTVCKLYHRDWSMKEAEKNADLCDWALKGFLSGSPGNYSVRANIVIPARKNRPSNWHNPRENTRRPSKWRLSWQLSAPMSVRFCFWSRGRRRRGWESCRTGCIYFLQLQALSPPENLWIDCDMVSHFSTRNFFI